MCRSYLYIKKPSTRDAWLFVEKSYDSSTGYNFLRKLIIAPLLDFRKQKCERRGSLCIFLLLFTRKLDTCCQAVRQRLYHARLQPHASKMHLKWAVIVTAHTVCVNSNIFLEHGLQPKTVHAFMLGTMASELSKFGLIKKLSGRDACIKKQSIFASCMLLFV